MWRFKGEESIKVFAMCRLVMGNKPSANCSQIALRETVAQQGGFKYKPWVISCQDVPEQILVAAEDMDSEKALGVYWIVREDKLFIKARGSGKNKSIVVELNSFLENPSLRLTLRECLSLHARAWDPLGFVLPVKMVGTLLFRKTLQFLSNKVQKMVNEIKIKNKLPWDLEIDGQYRTKWIEYFDMLSALKNITFDRTV